MSKKNFFYCEGVNLLIREGFMPSNKNEVCQGAGKCQVAVVDLP